MLRTPRLILRPFADRDREPWAAMNADPRVMEHFPALWDRPRADAFIDRRRALHARDGFAFSAIERRADGAFLGLCGLEVEDWDGALPACIEIGWRLPVHAWGQGYATEAARAWLDWGFETLPADRLPGDEIVAYTAVPNTRSAAVMARLGMRHDPARDFDHPALPEGHRLRRHVLCTITRADWSASRR